MCAQNNRQKNRIIDAIFLLLLIILIILSAFFEKNPQKAQVIQLSTYQNRIVSLQIGLWLTFAICFVGNILPVPTPYIIITWLVAQIYMYLHPFLPFFIAFIASLGSLVGEVAGYVMGRGANELLSQKEKEQAGFFTQIIRANPKLAPLLIYLFGATPLNDDLITVPLGMVKYSLKKTVFWCWLGKLTMMSIIAYFPDVMEFISVEYNFFTTMVPLFLVVIVMYAMIRVNWFSTLEKLPKLKKWLKLERVQDNQSKASSDTENNVK